MTKYGVQYNEVSQKFRIMSKTCGERAVWYPMGRIDTERYDGENTDYTKVRRVKAEDPQRGEFGTVTGDQVVCP